MSQRADWRNSHRDDDQDGTKKEIEVVHATELRKKRSKKEVSTQERKERKERKKKEKKETNLAKEVEWEEGQKGVLGGPDVVIVVTERVRDIIIDGEMVGSLVALAPQSTTTIHGPKGEKKKSSG